MEYRIEHDSVGEVKVPANRYWGAQTQRSQQNFPIGVGLETMPREITHAFGILKKAAAIANHQLRPEKMTDEKLQAISAASQGNFELNVFMPVCIYNFLQSARLLADAMHSFHDICVVGIKADKEKMAHNLHNSLMLVTDLNPYIGYENAAKTAKLAYKENISMKETYVRLGFLTEERFDEVFHPEQMILMLGD